MQVCFSVQSSLESWPILLEGSWFGRLLSLLSAYLSWQLPVRLLEGELRDVVAVDVDVDVVDAVEGGGGAGEEGRVERDVAPKAVVAVFGGDGELGDALWDREVSEGLLNKTDRLIVEPELTI